MTTAPTPHEDGRLETTPDGATGTRYRHVKRAKTYRIVGEAKVQASTGTIDEDNVVVVYRSEDDGKLWARERHEFYDGRFERLAGPAPAGSATPFPDGWKLVPVEPTEDMVQAFDLSGPDYDKLLWENGSGPRAAWSAMVAATPELPATPAPDTAESDEALACRIAKEEGYAEAVSDIDLLTGGDGEYVFSTFPGESCADPESMRRRIVDRFEALRTPAPDTAGAMADLPLVSPKTPDRETQTALPVAGKNQAGTMAEVERLRILEIDHQVILAAQQDHAEKRENSAWLWQFHGDTAIRDLAVRPVPGDGWQPIETPECGLNTDQLINLLTDDEGSTLTFCSSNADFNGLPNECVIANGFWTEWKDREFRADARRDCLLAALDAIRFASGLPELATPAQQPPAAPASETEA